MTPPRPTGSDEFAVWCQWVHDRLTGLKFQNSPTVKWGSGAFGYIASAIAGGQGGTSLKLYAVTTLYGVASMPDMPGTDYIGITPWDVTANDGAGGVSGSEILCAKFISGRQPAFETIDGELINYVYADDNHRIATPAMTGVEDQVCHLRYVAYDLNEPDPDIDNDQILVCASKVVGGTGVVDSNGQQIEYLEMQPLRAWSLQSS